MGRRNRTPSRETRQAPSSRLPLTFPPVSPHRAHSRRQTASNDSQTVRYHRSPTTTVPFHWHCAVLQMCSVPTQWDTSAGGRLGPLSFRSDPRRIRDQVQLNLRQRWTRRAVRAVVINETSTDGREEEETISHASVNIRNRGNLVCRDPPPFPHTAQERRRKNGYPASSVMALAQSGLH